MLLRTIKINSESCKVHIRYSSIHDLYTVKDLKKSFILDKIINFILFFGFQLLEFDCEIKGEN
jgi:hypothetical protein